MKISKTFQFALAIAAMMIMPMTANAQFGKLMNKAKGAAKTAVKDKADAAVIDAQKNPSGALEDAKIAKAGGLQKYLGLDDEAGQTVWNYYQRHLTYGTPQQDKKYVAGAVQCGQVSADMVERYKILMKGDKEEISQQQMMGNFPGKFKSWEKSLRETQSWKVNPISDKDLKDFLIVRDRIRDLYNQRVKELDL